MSDPIWKLLPTAPYRIADVVFREWPDGRQESCLVTATEYLAWLEAGNTPEPAEAPAAEMPAEPPAAEPVAEPPAAEPAAEPPVDEVTE